jgi:hypothetical protein
VGDAALRYAEAVDVRRLLRDAYDKTVNLPRLRLKVRATLKSADGAVANARRFYDAALMAATTLTPDQKDGGARFEAQQNEGLDY